MAVNKKAAPGRTKTAIERLEDLEQQVMQITIGANNALGQISGRVNDLTEGAEALLDVLSVVDPELRGKIEAVLKVREDQRQQAQIEQQKAGINALVDSGRIKAVTTITDDSIVIGREFDKDGVLVAPGRIQVSIKTIPEELQILLKGKGVADVIDLAAGGGKFEILEIYEAILPQELPAPAASTDDASAEPTPAEPASVSDSEPTTSV